MPQEIDDDILESLSTDKSTSFVARREAQKESAFVTRLYPAHGGRDPVGDATAAQAAHEGSTEVLNACIADLRADLESVQRLYARAIDAQVTLEEQVTRLHTESSRQVEEIRALSAKLRSTDEWCRKLRKMLIDDGYTYLQIATGDPNA